MKSPAPWFSRTPRKARRRDRKPQPDRPRPDAARSAWTSAARTPGPVVAWSLTDGEVKAEFPLWMTCAESTAFRLPLRSMLGEPGLGAAERSSRVSRLSSTNRRLFLIITSPPWRQALHDRAQCHMVALNLIITKSQISVKIIPQFRYNCFKAFLRRLTLFKGTPAATSSPTRFTATWRPRGREPSPPPGPRPLRLPIPLPGPPPAQRLIGVEGEAKIRKELLA